MSTSNEQCALTLPHVRSHLYQSTYQYRTYSSKQGRRKERDGGATLPARSRLDLDSRPASVAVSRPGALRRRDRTLDADRRDSANRAAARRELRRIAPPPPPRVGVGECLELGTRAQEEQAAVCGQVRAEPRRGEAAPQQASRPSGPGDGPQGWLGYGRERARFGLNFSILLFSIYMYDIYYV